ncbi:MAG: hypothetical protein FWE80_07850 [Oscillospiraceae bacterium]|nr:hypothetical protein [Oscillospiraceae bacterium]
MSDKKVRKNIRLQGYDYATPGAYFVTICTQNRRDLFGEIIIEGGEPTVGAGLVSAHVQMKLNVAGMMIDQIWSQVINEYPHVERDKYVIMPNHFHGIIRINEMGAQADTRPAPTVGDIICSFKSQTTHAYITGVKSGQFPPFHTRFWQRNYYEHILRDENEYLKAWEYIDTNPLHWQEDDYYASINST